MKKNTILFLLLICSGALLAQSVQDAKKFMYYERYNSAAQTAHNILQADPDNAEAWYWLTEAYLEQDNATKAKDSLMLAPADVKDEPYYNIAYGHILLQQHKKDSAQLYFDNAIKRTKGKKAYVMLAIANAHITEKNGDANYAIELINRGLKRDKKSSDLYTALGNAYRKLDNGTEAYKAYYIAIENNDKNAEAITQLGNIFVTQKNPEMYLKYFDQAIEADPNYAPAYYDKYLHFYYYDVEKAMEHFNKYVSLSDPSKEHDVWYTDLLYLTKKYNEAIENAQNLIARQSNPEPRLYKLIAYSYEGLEDTATAITYMNQYFANAPDSTLIVKDFETMAELMASTEGKKDSAVVYYQRALDYEKDTAALYTHYQNLAELTKQAEDYNAQAKWLGKYYTGNKKATNIDLFNWGIAHFRAKEFNDADSVFGLYIKKYPEQNFGYYWRARSNAAKDSALENGTAIPHYANLIEKAEQDVTDDTNKKWLIEAYGYMATYEANVEKDYQAAIDYFQKLLEIDPENKDAENYISILKKSMANNDATKDSES